MNSLPKTVTRQRRDCDLNPGPSAPESSTLTTRLPSHSVVAVVVVFFTAETKEYCNLLVHSVVWWCFGPVEETVVGVM